MPMTPQGEALATAHQTAQARNAAIIAALLIRLWQALVNPTQLATTTLRWLDLVAPQVLAYQAKSADLAEAFYIAYRAIEAPGAPDFTPVAAVLDPVAQMERIRTSLSVTGVVELEKEIESIQKTAAALAPQSTIDGAIRKATKDQAEQVAGAASRLVISGANDTVMANQKADKTAFGYVRLAHPDCCFFCAMLASRGPVYKDDSFDNSNAFFNGDGPAKIHDHDRCVMVPVFSRSDAGFKSSEEFKQTYDRVASEVEPGGDFLYEFRRVYEGRADGIRRGH